MYKNARKEIEYAGPTFQVGILSILAFRSQTQLLVVSVYSNSHFYQNWAFNFQPQLMQMYFWLFKIILKIGYIVPLNETILVQIFSPKIFLASCTNAYATLKFSRNLNLYFPLSDEAFWPWGLPV